MDYDVYFMKIALKEAEKAFLEDEVPVGAVVVINNEVAAVAHNTRESSFDPTAHAEIMALRIASQKINNWRLTGATLYVTKEPCIMCAGAAISARIRRLVYGCSDTKGGAVDSLYKILSDTRLNHQVEITHGVLKDECSKILQSFFRAQR